MIPIWVGTLSAIGAHLYFFGRVIYLPLYAFGVPYVRSLVWLVAAGGRVLNITALGHDISEARALAYAAIRKIRWHGGHFRRDIGKTA